MVSSMDLWEFALEGPRTRACRGQLRSLQPEPGSDLGDVRGLLALVAFDDIELDPVAACQGAVAVTSDGREMDEEVFAATAVNEAESLCEIEPLNLDLLLVLR